MDIVYLRMKRSLQLQSMQEIKLKDIAAVSSNSAKEQALKEMPIYKITKKDNNIVVIDSFIIVDYLSKQYQDLEFQLIGPEQTIIRIQEKQKMPSILITIFVWLLLFIGTAMTIINFHYDVSMQEVQQKLHYIITGEENDYPLWIQIPYSIGLGLGMLLFFNHWFNKRFNEEPSPLEVEIYNYQQSLDNYVSYYENLLNDPKDPF